MPKSPFSYSDLLKLVKNTREGRYKHQTPVSEFMRDCAFARTRQGKAQGKQEENIYIPAIAIS